jgi:hypothetical protein
MRSSVERSSILFPGWTTILSADIKEGAFLLLAVVFAAMLPPAAMSVVRQVVEVYVDVSDAPLLLHVFRWRLVDFACISSSVGGGTFFNIS